MRDENGVNWLTAGRLCELLQTIPPDNLVAVNSIGNLLVHTPDGKYWGFVDISFDDEGFVEQPLSEDAEDEPEC